MSLQSRQSSYIYLFNFFFFNDTATTEIYTLSLHDALPIYRHGRARGRFPDDHVPLRRAGRRAAGSRRSRSEEHTSELQSPCNLVCRLLLEKKKRQMALAMILTAEIYELHPLSDTVYD